MMKRISISFMALLYTASVLGVALNFHYCLNQVSSVKINAPVKSCTSLKVVKAMKCCKDKHIEVKVKDGHQLSSTAFVSQAFVFDLPQTLFVSYAPVLLHNTINRLTGRGPPDHLGQPPAYLANRNFRI